MLSWVLLHAVLILMVTVIVMTMFHSNDMFQSKGPVGYSANEPGTSDIFDPSLYQIFD